MPKLTTAQMINQAATNYKEASDSELVPLAFTSDNVRRELSAALNIPEEDIRVSACREVEGVQLCTANTEDDEYEVADDESPFAVYKGVYESPNGFVYRKGD